VSSIDQLNITDTPDQHEGFALLDNTGQGLIVAFLKDELADE
jgi:hypothetical protein